MIINETLNAGRIEELSRLNDEKKIISFLLWCGGEHDKGLVLLFGLVSQIVAFAPRLLILPLLLSDIIKG